MSGSSGNIPGSASTLVDILQHRAHTQPDQCAYTFLVDGEREEDRVTFAELDRQAKIIAAQLQTLQAEGERVLVIYPSGLSYIAALFGCFYAGMIAVPVYPPRANASITRLKAIAADAKVTVVLTATSILDRVKRFSNTLDMGILHWIATDQRNPFDDVQWHIAGVDHNTLAMLQYTSGSTGTPKGVMVSHGNLIYNQKMMQQAFRQTAQSIVVSWLPLYHDMGLIGCIFQPLYVGFPCVLMSPSHCIQKPLRWLQAMSHYKGTGSGAPNFMYELCVEKISPEQRTGLDLSNWQVAVNGAEPVRSETLDRFVTTFGPCGFRFESFFPCYGLAEATLIVSGRKKADRPVVRTFQGVVPGQTEEAGAHSLPRVGCGQTLLDQKIVIVDPGSCRSCSYQEEGEIWVSGPNVAQGYWNKGEETEQIFGAHLADTGEGPFLRTGDLGYLVDGELFVTGRLKDLIIIRGKNYYPQDIEYTVENCHSALRPGSGAACSIDVEGREQLVVIYEIQRTFLRNLDVDTVSEAVQRAVWEQHELQTYAVVLVKPGSIPKTSSGKIRRFSCRAGFLENTLDVVGMWKLNSELSNTPHLKSNELRLDRPSIALATREAISMDEDKSRIRADDLIAWLRNYSEGRINSRLIDERRSIPPYIVLDFGNQGLLGMQVAEKYGGLALKTRDMIRVIEQLAAIDLTLATFVGINNSLGIRPIQQGATQETRDALLPILAGGRELAAFSVTEPGAGSAVRAISTKAVPDGRGGWLLNGSKIWSGPSSWAGIINVFVQLVNAENRPKGITGFVVRQGTTGLRVGPEALTMGLRGMVQNTLYFDDLPVGQADMLGDAGKGLEIAQDAMMFARLGIAALSVGGMKRCAQLMHRYAARRSVATGCLLDNPVTLTRLSHLSASISATEILVNCIAQLLDEGQAVAEGAFIACKISGPEFFWDAADKLMQLLGGRGYIETNMVPQILRDARIFRIFEGPTEALRMHLGSNVIHQNKQLHQFLSEVLQTPEIWHRLNEVAEKIRAQCLASRAFRSDMSAALRQAYDLTGDIATWAILLSAAQYTVLGTPAAVPSRTLEWIRLQFEQAIDRAQTPSPAESVLLSASETTDLIVGFETSIGDLEQTLSGEDHFLDPFLSRSEQRLSPVNAPSAQPSATSQAIAPKAISIQTWLAEWIAKELSVDVGQIDVEQSFFQFGLDSITIIKLAGDLEVWLGRPLDQALMWDMPTLVALAQILAEDGEDIQNKDMPDPAIEQDIIDAKTAESLLPKIDQLSDREVDTYLKDLLDKEEDRS